MVQSITGCCEQWDHATEEPPYMEEHVVAAEGKIVAPPAGPNFDKPLTRAEVREVYELSRKAEVAI